MKKPTKIKKSIAKKLIDFKCPICGNTQKILKGQEEIVCNNCFGVLTKIDK